MTTSNFHNATFYYAGNASHKKTNNNDVVSGFSITKIGCFTAHLVPRM